MSLLAQIGNKFKSKTIKHSVCRHLWIKQGSEAIPIWNVLPWWTIGAVAAYLSHRGDYKEAQAVLAAYNNRSVETMSIRDNLNEARLAVVREAFVEAGAQASRIAQSGAPALGAAHS
jgi:hypothetical protein